MPSISTCQLVPLGWISGDGGVSASSFSSLALQEILLLDVPTWFHGWHPIFWEYPMKHYNGKTPNEWGDCPDITMTKTATPRMTYLPRGRSRRRKRDGRGQFTMPTWFQSSVCVVARHHGGKVRSGSLRCKVRTSIKGIFVMAPIYTSLLCTRQRVGTLPIGFI